MRGPSGQRTGALRHTPGMSVAVVVVSALLALLSVDRALYLASPWLPASFVRNMSPHAELRRIKLRPDSHPWIYAPNIRYAKPNATVDGYVADQFGYRNPWSLAVAGMDVDVLLLGDSFTWGSEDKTIADYLREDLAPSTIYSAGVIGEGIPQWRFHYQRFLTYAGGPPKIVVLNFYSGNDVRDTYHWLAIKDRFGSVSSAVYIAYLDTGRDREQLGASWLRRNLGLLELEYQLRHAFIHAGVVPDPAGAPAMLPDGYPPSTFYIRHEPNPAALTAEIFDEIRSCVAAIRNAAPDTAIIFAYIPTSGALYGDVVRDCPQCADDVARQAVVSAKLAQWARDSRVLYLDPTAELRQEATRTAIWNGAHFSPQGYALYSGYLAEAIRKATNGIQAVTNCHGGTQTL
jgi:hypothetical protein